MEVRQKMMELAEQTIRNWVDFTMGRALRWWKQKRDNERLVQDLAQKIQEDMMGLLDASQLATLSAEASKQAATRVLRRGRVDSAEHKYLRKRATTKERNDAFFAGSSEQSAEGE